MTPGMLRAKTTLDRIRLIRVMLDNIRGLPTSTFEEFSKEPVTAAAAESYLRRALEALMDLGRHLLAKGFGRGVAEYRQIARQLGDVGMVDGKTTAVLEEMAGYRNRMVHLYDEVTTEELYNICSRDLDDFEMIIEAFLSWIREHPDKIDSTI